MIKSRKARWAGHVARMGDRCVCGFGGKTLSERHRLEDVSVGGTVILKWMVKKSSDDLDWTRLPPGK